jgi:DNA-directed RNA polymerase alpha subunit
MLQFPNFGKKSLDEIKAILQVMGLSLGMKLPPSMADLRTAPAEAEETE